MCHIFQNRKAEQMLQRMRRRGDNRKQSTQASQRPPGPAARFHGGCAPSTAAGAGGRDQDFLFCTGDSWSDTPKWETTSGASQPRGKVKPRHVGDRCSLFLSLGKKAPLPGDSGCPTQRLPSGPGRELRPQFTATLPQGADHQVGKSG